MAFNLRFSVMGDVQLSRYFDRLSTKVGDFTPAFKKITEDFYEGQSATFESEGAFEGKSKWPKLSPQYARWKSRNYPGKDMLVLRGGLKQAVTSPKARGSIYQETKTSLTMGAEIMVNGWNLVALHQFGTRKMPARPVIELSNRQKKRWVDIIRNWHYDLIRGA